MTGDIPSWLGLLLALSMLAGWPFLFFALFRRREARSRLAVFLLAILSGLGAVWIGASLSDIALVISRRGGAVNGVLSAFVLGIVWLSPYVVLITWGAMALRRKHETS
jgi:hypothetical protein